MSEMSQRSAPAALGVASVIAAVAALLVGSAVALWAAYGSAVFYEMILAGLTACF